MPLQCTMKMLFLGMHAGETISLPKGEPLHHLHMYTYKTRVGVTLPFELADIPSKEIETLNPLGTIGKPNSL